MPAEHDGHRLFSFELVFSKNFAGRLDYKLLRDRAFQVGNGRVRGAKRAAQGRNDRWTISVRPASHGDVTVSLPAGSVTTEAGRSPCEHGDGDGPGAGAARGGGTRAPARAWTRRSRSR